MYMHETSEQVVAEIKRLFGPPALLSSEDEAGYYKQMAAFAAAFMPKDAFGMMQLKDMTDCEWRKNWLMRQQQALLDERYVANRQQQLRRHALAAEQDERNRQRAADLADPYLQDEERRRQFELECAAEETAAEVNEHVQQAEDEQKQAKIFERAINTYSRIDNLIQTKIAQRNTSAETMVAYDEVVKRRQASLGKIIDVDSAEARKQTLTEAPLAPVKSHRQSPPRLRMLPTQRREHDLRTKSSCKSS